MAHELNDSLSGNRVVTAFFEDRTSAQRAVDRLTGLGLPHSQVNLVEGNSSVAGTETVDRTSTTGESKGFFEALADFFIPDDDRHAYSEGLRRGGYVVTARVSEGLYDQALDILDDDGTIDLAERELAWKSEGWTGSETTSYGTAGTSGVLSASETAGLSGAAVTSGHGSVGHASAANVSASGAAFDKEEALEIVEENLRVGKRDVGHGRVRVRSYVIETPVQESVTLRQEHVDVQRRDVNRAVQPGEALFQERTIELEERSEEAVVSKEARVTGEVVVTKDTIERTEEISDTVRRTEVEIEDERTAKQDRIPRSS